jgi:hypothetical protein
MERLYGIAIRPPASLERLRRSARVSSQWLAVLVVLFCNACAPVPRHLYVPDGSDGKVLYSQCPMNGHLPVGVVFTREGVQVTVRLGEHDARDYVDVQLEIPEGKTVVLRTYTIKLDRRDSRPMRESALPNINPVGPSIVTSYSRDPAWQKEMLPLSTPLVGSTTVDHAMVLHKNFWFAAYIDPASAQDIWITLPELTINGKPVSMEDLHFRRRLMILVALINC